MKETSLTAPAGSSGSSGGAKIPLLIGAVVALIGASVYNVYQINDLKAQLAETRALVTEEVGKVSQDSTTSTKSTRASVDRLASEVAQARQHAAQLVGQARLEAAKEADELEAKLGEAQAEQAAETLKVAQNVNAVAERVVAVTNETNTNKERVQAVSTEVASVKKSAEATQAELQKTISALTSTQGDLGIQSGLIAKNGSEIAALIAMGDRNIAEFKIGKAKTAQRVGDLQVRLTKSDAKKNRYTIEVIVDDKKVEKKDRTTNEPVQFLVSRYRQPLELVVNEVGKDEISGYLSTPKVMASRKQQ
jgi:hypothetical protein